LSKNIGGALAAGIVHHGEHCRLAEFLLVVVLRLDEPSLKMRSTSPAARVVAPH